MKKLKKIKNILNKNIYYIKKKMKKWKRKEKRIGKKKN